MSNEKWALLEPIDAVVFDCDGTLSMIEGINVLADYNGVGEEVCKLTERAMSETGITPNIYQERLAFTQPTRQQLETLGEDYYQHRVPEIEMVIDILHSAGKKIFVLSAGMNPAVKIFAEKLKIPEQHVYAVDLDFDANGNYLDYDHACLPSIKGGKKKIVESLIKTYPRMIHVGDGMNDVVTKDVVIRFVGYGGAYYRESVKAESDCYITSQSMLPLLLCALTENEMSNILSKTVACDLQDMKKDIL